MFCWWVCRFNDRITEDFTPSKSFRLRSNRTVRIHIVLAYTNHFILSLFPFAPPHFLCSLNHSCYHCQAVNQLPLGVSPPAQEHLSMQKISFRNLNTHANTHTYIHAERKVRFYGILSLGMLMGCSQEVGGKFLFRISKKQTNKQAVSLFIRAFRWITLCMAANGARKLSFESRQTLSAIRCGSGKSVPPHC